MVLRSLDLMLAEENFGYSRLGYVIAAVIVKSQSSEFDDQMSPLFELRHDMSASQKYRC